MHNTETATPEMNRKPGRSLSGFGRFGRRTMKYTVPKNLRHATLSDIKDSDLRGLGIEYYEDHRTMRKEGNLLLLYGPEGSGKSFLASAIVSPLHATGYMIGWVDCNLWPTDFGLVSDLEQACCMAQALVFDDLGREPKHMRSVMARILHNRMETGKWTVITTNLTIYPSDPDLCELTKTYSRAVRSRLIDSNNDLVLLDGKDRRTNA